MALRRGAGAALGLAFGLALLGLAGVPALAQAPQAPAAASMTAAPQATIPMAMPACPPRQPRIRLSVVDPEPVLDTSLRIDALHAETGRPRSATLHHLALTTSRVEWHSEINARTLSGRGGVCATPDRVALTLVQSEHLIRIAEEIPPGTCLFREVEAHERRHVAVNRQTLRAAASHARTAAEAWAAGAAGRGATEQEAMAALQASLRRAIEPSLAAMRAKREAGHREIDAPAEYRRLARICPEDQRVLRERLRSGAVD